MSLGRAFTVTVKVKFQGCSFPLGGYFGKAALRQQSTDWLLRTLESGRLRALPAPAQVKPGRTAPQNKRQVPGAPETPL